MKLLVCGGRRFGLAPGEREIAFNVLDTWHARRPITTIIQGKARGADTLAEQWAESRGIPTDPYPVTQAEWDAWMRAGRPAPSPGSTRNTRMLAKGRPDAVLALPGGTGTAHMVRIATSARVPVALVAIHPDGSWSVSRPSR